MNKLLHNIQHSLDVIHSNLDLLRITSKEETRKQCLSIIGGLSEDISKRIQEYLKFGEE